MSTNIFNSNSNKELIWEMLLTNNMFNGIENRYFSNIKMMVENVITQICGSIKKDIDKDELIKLNKTAIIEIKKYLDIYKKTNNEDTFNNEKVLIFDKNLNDAKNDFSQSISIKKPIEPEFNLNLDTPIQSENMNDMLKRLQQERDKLLPNISLINQDNKNEVITNSNKINISETLPDILPKTINQNNLLNDSDNVGKKLNNIEELFNDKSNLILNKKVTFNDSIQKNPLLDNVEDIMSKEYSGEKKVNYSNKLNTIFTLLKDIDLKQEEILRLLRDNK